MHVATHPLCGWNYDNITTVLDGTHKEHMYNNDSPSQEQMIQYKDPNNNGSKIVSDYGQDTNVD